LTPSKFDVAIIGAGPAGSSAAIALARCGYAVALLEKERFPREKLCGDFINPINLPLLRELGVQQEILTADHERVSAFRITSFLSGEAEVPLPHNDREVAFGLGVSRASLDYLLQQQAGRQGAVLFQGAAIKDLQRSSSRWRLRIEQTGAVQELHAHILIGADGRNSWVAHRVGLASGAAMQGCAIGFQRRFRSARPAGGKVEIHLFPGGYAGMLGIGNGIINLALAVRKEALAKRSASESLWNDRLPQNPHLKEFLRTAEPMGESRSVYPVYFTPRRAVGDGVLLAGDAARVSEPVTGEGVYFALRSGLFAADAADRALQRMEFSAACLSIYEQTCRRTFAARHAANALLRFLMYRPALLTPLIRLCAKRRRLLERIVHSMCLPQSAL